MTVCLPNSAPNFEEFRLLTTYFFYDLSLSSLVIKELVLL